MTYKTKGIVLNFIKFKESSIICKIYTESFGLQSYIVNGVRSSNKTKMSLFQPLTILDLVVYNKSSVNIQRLKEMKIDVIYMTNHTDIKKISVCIFLSELLSKILSNEPNQNQKFNFLYNSFLIYDSLEKNIKNFHLQFLLKLTKFFGFQISDSSQITKAYLNKKKQNDFVMDCISMDYNSKIHSNYSERNDVLNSLIIYFSQSLGVNIKLKSLQVLKEVFTPV